MTIIIENKITKEIIFEKDTKYLENIETYPDSVEITFSFDGVGACLNIDLKENNFRIE